MNVNLIKKTLGIIKELNSFEKYLKEDEESTEFNAWYLELDIVIMRSQQNMTVLNKFEEVITIEYGAYNDARVFRIDTSDKGIILNTGNPLIFLFNGTNISNIDSDELFQKQIEYPVLSEIEHLKEYNQYMTDNEIWSLKISSEIDEQLLSTLREYLFK